MRYMGIYGDKFADSVLQYRKQKPRRGWRGFCRLGGKEEEEVQAGTDEDDTVECARALVAVLLLYLLPAD